MTGGSVRGNRNSDHYMLDVAGYRAILEGVPKPTDMQIEAFIKYVSSAHSWYKHLPLFPPGQPFLFYIDPNAGCDMLLGADGRFTPSERTEDKPGFHYSWQNTKGYRARFGYLEYWTGAGSKFAAVTSGGLAFLGRMSAGIFDQNGVNRGLPLEVLTSGVVAVTSIIHPNTDLPPDWYRYDLGPEANGLWPAETGGDDTLNGIRAILDVKLTNQNADELCRRLKELVEPERNRLRKKIEAAIVRVLNLIYG